MIQSAIVTNATLNCKTPQDLSNQLSDYHKLLSHSEYHPSKFLLPSHSPLISKDITKENKESVNSPIACDGETSPTPTPSNGAADHMKDRSLCPWYYSMNRDHKRYPVDITEAVCRSEKCGVNECHPVYYNVPVLRQKNSLTCDSDGYYEYEKGWQKISFGCSCAFPRMTN